MIRPLILIDVDSSHVIFYLYVIYRYNYISFVDICICFVLPEITGRSFVDLESCSLDFPRIVTNYSRPLFVFKGLGGYPAIL